MSEKKIISIQYNWHQVGSTTCDEGAGEDYWEYIVGKKKSPSDKKVVEINEHRPMGEGDKWFYDVVFDDESEVRIFNPNKVVRIPKK